MYGTVYQEATVDPCKQIKLITAFLIMVYTYSFRKPVGN